MFEVPLTSKIWQQGTALTPPALPACSQQVLLAVSPPMGFTCGGEPTVPPGASFSKRLCISMLRSELSNPWLHVIRILSISSCKS